MNLKPAIYFFSCCLLLLSCKENELPDQPDPDEDKKVYIIHTVGSGQYNAQNTYLADSIAVRVIDSASHQDIPGFKVRFTVQSGGGKIDDQTVLTNKNGFGFTYWKLGEENHEQVVTAQIFNNDDREIGNTTFYGYAFRPNIWDKVVIGPHRYIDDMVTDTIHGKTFITTTSWLWEQGDRYFDWDLVEGPHVGAFRIEMDTSGVIYIFGYNGGLEKSLDQGKTWVECNDPFGPPGYNEQKPVMKITTDNSIWLGKYGVLYHSTDNGNSWSMDTTGIKNGNNLGEIYSTKDSTFFLRLLNGMCYKSENGGKRWSQIETPYDPKKLYITKNNDIILMNNEGSHVALHKSTDNGKTFKKVFSVITKSAVGFARNIFHEYKGMYYILIPEFGIVNTSDFEDFEYYYTNAEANRLFIDHQGTFIVENAEWTRAYYFHSN